VVPGALVRERTLGLVRQDAFVGVGHFVLYVESVTSVPQRSNHTHVCSLKHSKITWEVALPSKSQSEQDCPGANGDAVIMGLPPVNNNKQEPYSGEGSKQPNKGLDKPQGMKGEQPKNDGDRPQGSMRTTGEAPKAKDEQQWKTVTRKERQIRKPEMMASTDTKATKATTQIASGDTKGKPVEAVNMSKINSMYRNLGTHAWADSDEEDDDYDPYPEMPAPNQSGNDGDIGADENFDLDEELFAERVVADGTVAIRDLDGVVHMWDKAAQRMMPMSRADAICKYPGTQSPRSILLTPYSDIRTSVCPGHAESGEFEATATKG
jgi:hypothetical protein